MIRRLLITLVVLGLIAGLAGFVYQRVIPVVDICPARTGPVVSAVYATGIVEPRDHVILKARVQGPLNMFAIREGDKVAKEQVLMSVQSPTLQYEMELAIANLDEAKRMAGADSPLQAELLAQIAAQKASVTKARADRERVQRLEAKSSAAAIEITDSQANLDRATNLLTSLQAALDKQTVEWSTKLAARQADYQRAAARYAECQVVSPLSGVVLQRYVEPGEVVAINQALIEVGDVHDLILTAQVDEQDVADLKTGQTAEVKLYAFQKPLTAYIYDIFPDADRINKTYIVKLAFAGDKAAGRSQESGVGTQNPEFKNKPLAASQNSTSFPHPPALKSGMTGEVYVVTARQPVATIISSRAVASDGSVFVENHGRLEHRTVQLGLRSLLTTQVVEGIAPGEAVVVGGLSGAHDGQYVRVHTVEMPSDPLTQK